MFGHSMPWHSAHTTNVENTWRFWKIYRTPDTYPSHRVSSKERFDYSKMKQPVTIMCVFYSIAMEKSTVNDFTVPFFRELYKYTSKKEQNAIILDGMEFLIQANGYKRVLDYIKYLEDKLSSCAGTLFVTVNSGTLKENEMATLEKRFDRVIV